MDFYSPPSLKVYQEFTPQLPGNALPLFACIVAPQYGLHRYTEESEQASLGAYNPTSGNTFNYWPDKTPGSTVDVTTAQMYMEDAVLKYNLFNTTGTGTPDDWDGLLEDDKNKVRSSSLIFASGNGYTRSSVFGTRDVEVGDYVDIAWAGGAVSTRVSGLEADQEPASVAAAMPATENAPDVPVESVNVTQSIASGSFTVTAAVANYDGLEDGELSDIYTIEVIATNGRVDGTTVKVVSATGKDDVASLLLAGSGIVNPCGNRGATFTVTDAALPPSINSSSSSGSSSSSEAPYSTVSSSSTSSVDIVSSSSSSAGNDLVVGDYWTVEVKQQYTAPTPVSGGIYNGGRDTTYLVKVTTGGEIGVDSVKFQITTTNGYDSGAPVTVTAPGSFTVGNYGVTMTVAAAETYAAGDYFLIDVTAAKAGAIRTLILSDNLVGATKATPLSLTMGLVDTVLLGENMWTASDNEIMVSANAEVVGTYLGTQQTFKIMSAEMFVEYRELLVNNTYSLSFITSQSEVEDTLGPVTPLNPLSLMVYSALAGSNGTAVYYIGVVSDDVDGYMEALEKLTEASEPYSIVPYNTSREVGQVVQAHVNEMSGPDIALFRIMWRGLDIDRLYSVYTELDDGSELLVTINGTTVTAANGQFVAKEVKAGDYLRVNYRQDGQGNIVYDSYIVDHVVTENELELVSGPAVPITVPVKSEIWRLGSLNEYATLISNEATAHTDRRVTAVWSEELEMFGFEDLSRAYLCALLAGMRSSGAPHQPMSLAEVPYVTLTVKHNFSRAQLDLMGSNGVWLVVQDTNGVTYVRHQLTTDPSDVFTREQSVTTNADQICRDYKNAVSDLYGRGNVSEPMLRLIEGRMDNTTTSILSRTYPDIIGPQLHDIEITRLEIDPALKDQVWVEADLIVPVPMNHLVLKFRLV